MSEDLGKAYVTIEGQWDEFGKEADSRIGGIMGGIAAKGTQILAGIATAGAAAGGFGLTIAANAEQAEVAFTSLLGSGEAAKTFMGELSSFAAATPFELPGLQDSASRLLAFGVSADEVIPLMSALGDSTAAVGTGEDGIARATAALGKMQQQGKVSGEAMQQLTEAGIPAWDALAAKLGTDVAGAQQMVADGQVEVNDVMASISERAGPAMQRVNGMMEAQSQTMNGLLSTLKDTASINLGTAMQPALDIMKDLMPLITSGLGDALTAIGPEIGQIVTLLGGGLKELLPAITPLLKSVAGLGLAFMEMVMPALEAVMPMLGELTPVFDAISETMVILAEPLGLVVGILADILVEVLNLLAPMLPMIATAFAGIVEALVPLLPPLAQLVLELIAPFLPMIEQLLPVIVTLASLFATVLAEALQIVTPILTWLIDLLAGVIGWVVDMVAGMTEATGPIAAIWNGIGSTIGAVWTGITTAAQVAQDFIVGVWNLIQTTTETVWNAISETVGGIVTGLGETISGVWNSIVEAVKGAINSVIDAINMVIDAINDTLEVHLTITTPPGFDDIHFDFNPADIPRIPRLHSGGVVPGATGSEVLTLLQAGEGVLSIDDMRLGNMPFFDVQEPGKGGGGNTFNVTSTAPVVVDERRLMAMQRDLEWLYAS